MRPWTILRDIALVMVVAGLAYAHHAGGSIRLDPEELYQGLKAKLERPPAPTVVAREAPWLITATTLLLPEDAHRVICYQGKEFEIFEVVVTPGQINEAKVKGVFDEHGAARECG